MQTGYPINMDSLETQAARDEINTRYESKALMGKSEQISLCIALGATAIVSVIAFLYGVWS